MIIGTKPDSTLKVDDIVILRMEPSAGVGFISRARYDEGRGEEIYWCQFPKRSHGYFAREDLHCDRLDGKKMRGGMV